MAQYNITLSDEILKGLFSGDRGVAGLLEQVLNQVLQAQASEQLKTEPYERSEDRQGYRNGTRPRAITTRVGTLVLRVPRLRTGKFSTELFARYQRSEQALLITMMEMVVNGVSTRKVAAITEELCGQEFSKSTVSDLCKRLDPIVQGWNERSLKDKRYPFVLMDAIVLKIREDGRVRPRAAMIATGISEDGYREVLGIQVGDSESEAGWSEFFSWLKGRGLHGVDIVVSDSHSGLVKALQAQFQGSTWQRCQTHFMRNFLDAVPKNLQEELYGKVRAILDAPDVDTARLLLKRVVDEYGERASKAVDILESAFDDITAVLVLPERYRKRLRTTNGQERLNEEIRRRDRVIRIYPNRDSVMRLIGALLMEIDEKWQTGHGYFDMTEYWAWREEQAKKEKEKEKEKANIRKIS
ncbi:IS256 family transposase [Alicyclobacillus sp.]|uniref:IS256 family transposase n=1 Tax=Alicyclobacillus sp. TaxID=61169 RepID=UPI0025C32C77|nr:IS256 family transposase [Alicyclobacillus sp.]MCL6516793.1 IS256 family transposase [Alicyclobacillus sp.]